MAKHIWQYSLKSAKGEGWAEVLLREDGYFSAVSDYGNYAYWWRHTGHDDVRKFFVRADWGYFVSKLSSGRAVSPDASFANLLKHIVRERREGSLSKEEARERYNYVKEARGEDSFDWDGFLRNGDTYKYWSEPWYFTVTEYPADVLDFCQKTLPRLAELIRVELDSGVS